MTVGTVSMSWCQLNSSDVSSSALGASGNATSSCEKTAIGTADANSESTGTTVWQVSQSRFTTMTNPSAMGKAIVGWSTMSVMRGTP